MFPLICPHTLRTSPPSSEEIIEQHSTHFVFGDVPVSSIPRGEGWKWSQSRKRVATVDSTGLISLEFFKLHRRWTRNTSNPLATCKVWVYHMNVPALQVDVTVLWCEVGCSPTLSCKLQAHETNINLITRKLSR